MLVPLSVLWMINCLLPWHATVTTHSLTPLDTLSTPEHATLTKTEIVRVQTTYKCCRPLPRIRQGQTTPRAVPATDIFPSLS